MRTTNAILLKTSTCWLIVLKWDNGDCNEYRFPTKTAALTWARRAGVTLVN